MASLVNEVKNKLCLNIRNASEGKIEIKRWAELRGSLCFSSLLYFYNALKGLSVIKIIHHN